MKMNRDTYQEYVKARAPKSPLFADCLRAFTVGGLICTAAEGIRSLWLLSPSVSEETAGTLTSVCLVFVAVVLTAAGVFDEIAKFSGAGTLVPITGFANAVVSPAMDARSEGLVLGVGAKIFTVAGPVLLYGTLCGAVYGLVLWAVGLF